MPQNESAPRRRWFRGLLIAGGVCLLLLALGVAGLKLWADGYLRSESFRRFVSSKLSDSLKADTELAPFQYQGLTVFTDHVAARGTDRASFASLRLDHVRAAFSTRRVWDGVWLVEELEVAKARMDLEGTRGIWPEPLPSAGGPRRERRTEPPSRKWFANRVELGNATIKDTTLNWKDGGFTGTHLQIQQSENGWDIAGTGGVVTHGTLPPADLEQVKLRFRPPTLYVQDAVLRERAGGSVQLTGEVILKERVALQARVQRLPIGRFLPKDWRVKLQGNLSGDVSIQTPLPPRDSPSLAGTVHLTEGQLEALPILEEIATFTGTEQFRRLALTRVSGDFQRRDERLSVQNFVAESAGLIRVEGAFEVMNDQIEGDFQVGVTPASLQWIPGSRARVFTVARDGYLWTPMRLSGPLEKPKEDLSPRLIAAAQGELIDRASETARDVLETARDAAKGALDLLLGR